MYDNKRIRGKFDKVNPNIFTIWNYNDKGKRMFHMIAIPPGTNRTDIYFQKNLHLSGYEYNADAIVFILNENHRKAYYQGYLLAYIELKK